MKLMTVIRAPQAQISHGATSVSSLCYGYVRPRTLPSQAPPSSQAFTSPRPQTTSLFLVLRPFLPLRPITPSDNPSKPAHHVTLHIENPSQRTMSRESVASFTSTQQPGLAETMADRQARIVEVLRRVG